MSKVFQTDMLSFSDSDHDTEALDDLRKALENISPVKNKFKQSFSH